MNPRRRRWRLAAAVGPSTFLVLAGTVTASAVWTTSTASLAATANAETISSSLAQTVSLGSLSTKYTGTSSPAKVGTLAYANTGTSPLSVALSVTGVRDTSNNPLPLAPHVNVQLWSTTATTCPAAVPGGTPVGTLSALPALPAAVASLTAGATIRLCVATSMNAALSTTQGLSITPVFTLKGTVGANWSTEASTSFTQSVYRIAQPGTIDCVNGTGFSTGNVTLSWASVPNATQYYVYKEDGTAVNKTITTSTVSLTPDDLGLSALVGVTRPVTVRITAYEGNGFASTSLPTTRMIRVEPAHIGLGAALKCTP